MDPLSATGLPPGYVSVVPLRPPRDLRLVLIAVVALALAAVTGVTVTMRSGSTAAAPGPRFTPRTPFPSPSASNSPAKPASSPPRAQPTPKRSSIAPQRMPVLTIPVSPSAAPTVTASPAVTVARPTVTVSYLVVSRWYGGFEGEVAVINRGPSPIPDWQIVVALPDDQFTAISSNASGYASHHILLLNPASDANSVPAEGTLSVFFTAYGTRLTPQLCAFNDTTCG